MNSILSLIHLHSFEFPVVGEGLCGDFGDLILLQPPAKEIEKKIIIKCFSKMPIDGAIDRPSKTKDQRKLETKDDRQVERISGGVFTSSYKESRF